MTALLIDTELLLFRTFVTAPLMLLGGLSTLAVPLISRVLLAIVGFRLTAVLDISSMRVGFSGTKGEMMY